MKPNEYVELAVSTEATNYEDMLDRLAAIKPGALRLLHAAMGMCTEAGEFQDALKRHIFYGAPLDTTNLQEEVGDHLWYCALACHVLGIDMEEVMRRNIGKLAARYPNKFDMNDAIVRDLVAERKILEGKKD